MNSFLTKIFIIYAISAFFNVAQASYEISKVHVNCGDSEVCKRFKKSFSRLSGNFDSEEHFQAVMREYLSDVGYEGLSFSLKKSTENSAKELHLNITPKKFITEVQVYLNDQKDTLGLQDLLLTKVDAYYDESNAQSDLNQIKSKLSQQGYVNVSASFEKVEVRSDIIKVIFAAKFAGTNNIDEIQYRCKNDFVIKMLKNSFNIFLKKPYVRDYIQQEITMLRKTLMEQGFYQLEVNQDAKVAGRGVQLGIDCKNDNQILINFFDESHILSWSDIYADVRALISRVDSQFIVKELTQFIEQKYALRGRKSSVKVTEKVDIVSSSGEEKITYSIEVRPSVRVRTHEILFRGNSSLTHTELEKLFQKNATDLAKAGYVDEDFYMQFVEIIKKHYMEQGLLTTNVYYLLREELKEAPNNSSMQSESVRSSFPRKTVIFDISEGTRSLVSSFKILGIENSGELLQLHQSLFSLRQGEAFNPLKFDADMTAFLQAVKDQGYYDAHYVDDGVPVVTYERTAQLVHIHLHLHLGPVYRVRHLYVVGLNKTVESVVTRKVRLQPGDLLTTQLLDRIQSNVANLALFKSYEVKVLDFVGEKFERDIVIHVQEKDFGTIELAPGYRTDLGLRLAAKVSYNNLFGKNHSASAEVELNNRLSNSDLDPSRSSSLGSMLEYEGKLNYNLPDLFKSYWDYNISLSSAKRRLYSFDAEIQRFTNTFNHDFSDELNFSLRQQLEIIHQFNAVQEINEGSFRIGSLTPSLTLDKRNSLSYATKGYLLNVSYELAKPEFYSSDSNGYEIDFYKLVTRNRFYVPFSSEFGLAFSVTLGMQENLRKDPFINSQGNQVIGSDGQTVKKGFIPSIKVFRLTGIDTVRGFSEDEINRLANGNDITEELIQNKVYMTNVKVEPRYLMTDDMVLGAFWDAGKVQVNSFEPTDMRSSVGLSFKYITPVGTLDFDYGLKLLRKRYADGTLESPGRIHISIGFF